MAIKFKHTQSSPWVEPIGILSDFTALLHYQNEAKNQSDNKLQIYDPNRDRYLNWISYDEENEYSSSVFSELHHDYSAFFSKNTVRSIISKSFDSQYKNKFTETIISTVFVDGEDNMATIMFAQLLSIDKDANLTQYLSVALCKVFENYGLSPEIKWPNDVKINGKKISGNYSCPGLYHLWRRRRNF